MLALNAGVAEFRDGEGKFDPIVSFDNGEGAGALCTVIPADDEESLRAVAAEKLRRLETSAYAIAFPGRIRGLMQLCGREAVVVEGADLGKPHGYRVVAWPEMRGAIYFGHSAQLFAAPILNGAEDFLFHLWSEQGCFTRQAIFWNMEGVASTEYFGLPGTREENLDELEEASHGRETEQILFLHESNVVNPDGREIEALVLEVGHRHLNFYGQRFYRAMPEPELLYEQYCSLKESPFSSWLKAC